MIRLDPDNAVVQLCIAGVEAEQRGDGDAAAALYRRAWERRTSALESTIAAHYVARVQPDAASRLRWNTLALERAIEAQADEFLPSLHLNLGHSLEEAGDLERAAAHHAQARASLEGLRDQGVADSLRPAVDRALARTRPSEAEAPARSQSPRRRKISPV